jgi:hypothetical protein
MAAEPASESLVEDDCNCGWCLTMARDGPRLPLALRSPRRNLNARLISADTNTVTSSAKDYRVEGAARYKTMSLVPVRLVQQLLLPGINLVLM